MSLNFDVNSNSRKKVSHYEKNIKMCQFYSDSFRFFFLQQTVPTRYLLQNYNFNVNYMGCSFKFIVNVVVGESIVNAPFVSLQSKKTNNAKSEVRLVRYSIFFNQRTTTC
jgi:hypothetical protein